MIICNEKPPKEWQGEYLLECLHSFNSKSRIEYLMYCNFIKDMPNNRVKIKVFGTRFSMKGCRIRYVDKYRLHNAEILKNFNLEH